MENSKYSTARIAGREHIPLYPNNFIALRIVQLVVAVIVIGLAAYGVSGWAFDGDIFIMVVGLMTMIVTIYYIVAETASPAIYNYWAVLSLDIFLVIMWLASFALLASEVAAIYSYTSSTYYDYYTGSYYTSGGLGGATAWAACLAAASGLGGLEFALFIGSLATHGVMLHRHRKAGLHCTPGAAPTYPTGGSEFKQQPTQTTVPVQQQYAAPQQQAYAVPAPTYPQQPYQTA
ncbi:hypothetical protein CONLIGDRAFT_120551 [Coniochaeta ligniaria NRRL 30616]|uniref:MARVEL domain-containing protein n=1 Tax=Coniochaeta ligniaria NRRL 30616 TaxID=1408157 RepID=A0A1J7J8Y5_9PEZI|nr:hypothetical protein CONLIGDRAFT_120551 [Coniochaeta ligniaria NRRL 30616]